MLRPANPETGPDALYRRVLTRAEVARMFAVRPDTVTRWADEGRLPSFRTPGGTRRFYADDVEQHLPATTSHPEPPAAEGP